MKKTAIKLLSVSVALSMLLVIFQILASAESKGLAISTVEQLSDFACSVNNGQSYEGQTVVLTKNLFLGADENPWIPIGTASNPFKGTFNANYHVISGLYIEAGSMVGLFGNISDGTVENLVVDGNVTGTANVAAVAAKVTNGNILNCASRANVTGDSNVGGIVGSLNGKSNVTACFNTGNIKASTGYIGGIVGYIWGTVSIDSCYNTGIITGTATVGGIAGGHKAQRPTVSNCYHAGKMDTNNSQNNVGAIIGGSRGTNTNCYYLTGSGTNTKSGITEVSAINAADLNEKFVDQSGGNPALFWESGISSERPVRPAFVEKTALSAQLTGYIKNAISSKKSMSESNTLLGDPEYLKGASSTETDWMALAMARFGYYDKSDKNYCYMFDDDSGYSHYLAAMKMYVETTYKQNNGMLNRVKATEWHRAAVTISALGGDPENVGSYNNNVINLIADGSYNCVVSTGPGKQGINGWIWGLIALDTGVYNIPADAKYSREEFITEILKMQLTDGVNGNEYGGWVLGGYGSSSDVDITAMAVQALAPYYNDDTKYTYKNELSKKQVTKTVRQCVNEAVDRLGSMMNQNAGFTSWNTDNSESISQVIVALTSIGIDPAKDERFITSDGKTLLDGLLRFKTSNGGFCHVLNSGWNSMANDQATYALVSYWRFENRMRSLYDMRGEISSAEKDNISAAVNAINNLPDPADVGYKKAVKSANKLFFAVDKSERRYVNNYNTLAEAIELVGGEANLDTESPYTVKISVSKLPNKTNYFEGESFDATGMEVTAHLNDNTTSIITDYKLSNSSELKVGDSEIVVTYKGLKATVAISVSEKMPWEGNGTAESPYLIKSAEDLESLSNKVNKRNPFTDCEFKLANDIDLGNIENWEPIGISSLKRFDGVFDGNGFCINNLNSKKGGLFKYAGSKAVIKNVSLIGGKIQAGNLSFVGSIVGWSNGADIINCMSSADIYCSGYSGGIVGTVRDGGKSTISGCVFSGSIKSDYGTAVGGIVGHLDTSRTGTSVEVTVINCYNTGSVSSSSTAGGIVGMVQDGNTIKNCYNIGSVSANNSSAAPIVSTITSKSIIENCFYNNNEFESGVYSGVDGSTQKSDEQMKSEDFVVELGDAFKVDKYSLENKGYPLLLWQSTKRAQHVDDTIEKINKIKNVTLNSKNDILSARNAYDLLDPALKVLVGNFDVLQNAESAYNKIISELNKNSGSSNSSESEETISNSGASVKTETQNNADSRSPKTSDTVNLKAAAALMLCGIFVVFVTSKQRISATK